MENKLLNQLPKTPAAVGGSCEVYLMDGKAIKVMENACYEDVLQECLNQMIAAEAGLAPQVHSVIDMKDRVVIIMDAIDFDVWCHPDGLDDADDAPMMLEELGLVEQVKGLRLYCQLLNAGIVHADFHSGNWFVDDKGNTIAIDFGQAGELHNCREGYLKAAVSYLLPVLQNLGFEDDAIDLYDAYITGPDAIRSTLARIAMEIA